jgi:hypothetical protein
LCNNIQRRRSKKGSSFVHDYDKENEGIHVAAEWSAAENSVTEEAS